MWIKNKEYKKYTSREKIIVYSQKITLCIRSCETMLHVNTCGNMYKRFVEETKVQFSEAEEFYDACLSLHRQLFVRRCEIAQNSSKN